jgi:hypothetical protein
MVVAIEHKSVASKDISTLDQSTCITCSDLIRVLLLPRGNLFFQPLGNFGLHKQPRVVKILDDELVLGRLCVVEAQDELFGRHVAACRGCTSGLYILHDMPQNRMMPVQTLTTPAVDPAKPIPCLWTPAVCQRRQLSALQTCEGYVSSAVNQAQHNMPPSICRAMHKLIIDFPGNVARSAYDLIVWTG